MTAVTGPGGRLTPSYSGRAETLYLPVDTAEVHAAQERRSAVREAAQLVAAGRRGRAQFVLARSVMRQARILGVGHTDIGPTCPCGGRCPAGHSARGAQ